jgi:hypothetical protein
MKSGRHPTRPLRYARPLTKTGRSAALWTAQRLFGRGMDQARCGRRGTRAAYRGVVTTLVAASTLGLAACGSSSSGGSSSSSGATGSTPSGASGGKTVTFMISTGLTGQSAFYGKGATLAAQLLAKTVNSAGGLKDKCGNT